MSQPRIDTDAAPAHRRPPRNGAITGRKRIIRVVHGARSRFPVRCTRYLRDGWTMRDGLSSKHRHWTTGEALPPPAAIAGRTGMGRTYRQSFCRHREDRALGTASAATHAKHDRRGRNAFFTRAMKRFAGDNMAEWMPDTPLAAGAVPKTNRAGSASCLFSIVHFAHYGTTPWRA